MCGEEVVQDGSLLQVMYFRAIVLIITRIIQRYRFIIPQPRPFSELELCYLHLLGKGVSKSGRDWLRCNSRLS
ncbi:Hypothetical protein Y17_1593 [Pectobacterium wasabiae CFBP 3304]|nr:Hypothetical protein Y17_1593 [Pectobacterium wasabiae CFBP 3304]